MITAFPQANPEFQTDLSVEIDGLRLPNPFIIASGPPSTNGNVMARAFDEGWGAVVCKTLVLDVSRIVNVSPRFARMRASGSGEIVGWENIELISDRPFDLWIDEFKMLKDRDPGRVVIASVMEEFAGDAWAEIIQRCDDAGVDAFELNLSCPHGLPERNMGSAMGQDPQMVFEVCSWARTSTRKPIWAKLTPNVMRIEDAGAAALAGGASGLSAINTIRCVMGINMETLRPTPTVEGFSTVGGYSGRAVRPIALRMVMELGQMLTSKRTATNPSISALGGIESGEDAAQFILVGANTVQVCTGVMIHGYGLIHKLKAELSSFMARHSFETIEDFRGASLPYFTTHAELVELQKKSKSPRAASTVTSLACD